MRPETQKLIDAHEQRQQDYKAEAFALATLLIGLLDESEASIRVLAERLIVSLSREGVDLSSRIVQAQIQQFRSEVFTIRNRYFDTVLQRIRAEINDLTVNEWSWMTELYDDLEFTDVSPTNGSLVFNTPFLGRNFEQWIHDLVVSDSARISDTVVIGLIQNQPKARILEALLGNENLNGGMGTTDVSRRHLHGIIENGVFGAVAQVIADFGEQNSLFFDRELYIAVIDDRTTKICRSLHLKVFPRGQGPIPPLHWWCRSRRVLLPVGWQV